MERRRLATLILLSALAAGTAGCKNGNCTPEVQDRLLNDCKLTIGISNSRCLPLSGAPQFSDPNVVPPQIQSFRQESCEITDPESDPDCFLKSSCEEIEMGRCAKNDAPTTVTNCITTECAFQVQMGCAEKCGMRADYDACSKCTLECAQADADCRAACKSKG